MFVFINFFSEIYWSKYNIIESSKISKLFNVSVETIRQDNDNLDIIRPGQILKITIKAF